MGKDPTSAALYESLLMAGLRATAFVLGARQLKMYVKSLGEVFVNDLPERIGVNRAEESDPAANVAAFAKVEDATGAYDAGHVTTESVDGGFKVIFNSCPYAGPCGEVLSELIESGQFTKKNLPCFRSDVAAALIGESSGLKTSYELEQFAPGFKCVSHIQLI